MADIGTARVLITGDYSRLAADFNAAQGVASTGASAIGRSVQQAFTPATLIVDQFGRAIQSAAAQATAAAPQVNSLASSQVRLKQTVDDANTSLSHQVTQIQAVSGTIRTLDGNQGIRAAERFLTMIPGLGAALQVAFPLIGAVALFEVIGRGIGKFGELSEAEKKAEEETTKLDEAWDKLSSDFDRGEIEKATVSVGKLAGTKVKAFFDEGQAQRDRALLKQLTGDLETYKQRASEAAAAATFDNSSFIGQIQRLDPISGARKIVALQDWKQQQAQVESLGKQISELTEKVRLYEQITEPLNKINIAKTDDEDSGSIRGARVALQEAQLKHQSDLNKAYTEEEIQQSHAAAMKQIDALDTVEMRQVAAAGEGLRVEKAKQAALTNALAEELPKRIALLQAAGAAESQGKDPHEQDRIGLQTQTNVENAQASADNQTLAQTARVADAQTKLADVVVTTNREIEKSWEEVSQKGSLASFIERQKLALAGLTDLLKKQAEADRAAEGRAAISQATAKAQGEVDSARLKADYELQGTHSIQQQITYRQQLADIQRQEYASELASLEAKLAAAQALDDQTERSRQVLEIEKQIVALKGQAAAADIASKGQIGALQQNPIQQMGKEFSSVGIKDVDVQGAKNLAAAVNNVAAGLANAIVHAKGFGQAITAAGKQLATALLTTVIEAGLKRIVGALLSLLPAFATVTSAQGAAAVQQKAVAEASVLTAASEAAAWAFESVMAALPFPVNVAVAPEVAAATFGQATAIGSFERGTDSAPGGLAMVGEKGPELLNLPRGAQVIPNDILRSAFNLPRAARGGNLSTPGGSAGLSSGGGGDLHVHLNGDFHAHGVNDPTRLAERMVDQIPAVLKRRSASFSPYSK